jgi:hypothetical protein
MTTAFAGAEQPGREALLSAPLRWPRPSALELALNAGTAKATEAAQQLGLHTIGDLLEHLPRDRRESRTVAALTPGESATVVVEVRSITSRSVRRRGMKPLSSATVASTSGFMPRRRTGRDVIERTSTTTVATSSGPSSAIVRASERSRGRCSSRSPMVSSPRRSAPFAAGAGFSSSAAASSDGRGQRGPASSRSSVAPSGAEDANASGGVSTRPSWRCSRRGRRAPCGRYSAAISHQ